MTDSAQVECDQDFMGDVREIIHDSWQRSRAAGVRQEGWHPRLISNEVLDRRRAKADALISVARGTLASLENIVGTVTPQYAIGLADKEGVLLCSVCGPGGTSLNIFPPGCDLSEASVGTSAPGLALVTGKAESVHATEHYNYSLHDLHSYAAFVMNESGQSVAILFVICKPVMGKAFLTLVKEYTRGLSSTLAQRKSAQSAGLWALISSFIAHELGNPLTVLKGNLGLLGRQVGDERALEKVRRCEVITEQMVSLVKDLRALGGARTELKQVNVQAFLEDLVETLPTVGGISMTITGDPSLHIIASPTLLGLAVENLVRNALDALADDGGQVHLIAERTTAGVRLSVQDDGPGIPHEMRPGLFHCAVTTKEQGSGLGLLLVRSIVENAHGGRITYAPNRPRGSVFHIDLPESVDALEA